MALEPPCRGDKDRRGRGKNIDWHAREHEFVQLSAPKESISAFARRVGIPAGLVRTRAAKNDWLRKRERRVKVEELERIDETLVASVTARTERVTAAALVEHEKLKAEAERLRLIEQMARQTDQMARVLFVLQQRYLKAAHADKKQPNAREALSLFEMARRSYQHLLTGADATIRHEVSGQVGVQVDVTFRAAVGVDVRIDSPAALAFRDAVLAFIQAARDEAEAAAAQKPLALPESIAGTSPQAPPVESSVIDLEPEEVSVGA